MGRELTLFRFDEMVVWREIEKYMEMSQQFCPGLQLLSCHAVVIYYMRRRGEGWMKRWMDRTNGRDVSTLSSKINTFENLNILLTVRLTCIIYAKFSLEFSALCQTPCLEALLHHFHQLGIPFSFLAIL